MFGGGMDAVKAEKERAMLRYRRLRRAAALSRCLLEAFAALSLLSWSSARLPAASALCAGLRHLPAVLLHPLSAFLVGNAIIVTLVAKSSEAGVAAPPPSSLAARPVSSGVQDHRHHHHHHHHRHISASTPQQRSHREEAAEKAYVVYEDKGVLGTIATTAAAAPSPKNGKPEGPHFQRTRSEDFAGLVAKKGAKEKLLRRSRSQAGVAAGAKWWDEGEEEEEVVVVADDSEEFRQKIEAFIARQLRFIEREEESLLLAARAASAASSTGALRVTAGSQVHSRR